MRPLGLVLGPERSGTSAVARILHELGFCMGHKLTPPDEDNPEGYFEDMVMRDPSLFLAREHIPVTAWLEALEGAHPPDCQSAGWGVKHPALCNAAPRFIREIAPAFIVITARKREKVVASLLKSKHRVGGGFASELWHMRTRGTVRILREFEDTIPTEVFVMDDHVPEDRIRAGLEAIIEESRLEVIR